MYNNYKHIRTVFWCAIKMHECNKVALKSDYRPSIFFGHLEPFYGPQY